ncbi:MAG: GAF domain-containing sensor histidine kinase [Bacteroidales bacterium]|nr:GAF domain-containing sensor histidine kinase [Bacteroidales bacterium]
MKDEELDKNPSNIQDIIKEYERKENDISELLIATKAILKSNDFQVTAKQVFDGCARTIGAKAGYVALLSDNGEENELLFLENGGMPCTVDESLPMPIRGLRERAYRTGSVVYSNDFMKSEWVKFMPKGHMPLKNVLFSPLNIDNKTVGIMGFACKDGDFTEHDAKMAAAFGDYAAIALQNSKTLDELHTSNATKDRFFSIVAHDLKSPFVSLIYLSEMLENESKNAENKKFAEYASMLHQSLSTSYKYLNNLLDWSRLQTNRIGFTPVEFNLLGLTNEIIDVLILQSQNKKIEIKVSIPNDLSLFADKNMIKTVFINLVSNAIKYSNSNSEVIISAYRNDNRIVVKVEDSGVGINNEGIEKLFKIEESYTVPGTNDEIGTGLGLILCKEFINKHNGQIGVESEVDKGSVFWFSLPVIGN